MLASKSPRRNELLRKIRADFAIEVAEVEELSGDFNGDVRQLPRLNAELKAAAVAEKFPHAVVIGADTVVVLDNVIYGKPRDLQEARDFLRKFSGVPHEVLTGVSVQRLDPPFRYDFTASTKVFFKVLTEDTITLYLDKVQVLDKAGAYAIQECGDLIVDHIEGSMDNVIGLPTEDLAEVLNKITC